MDAPAPPTRRTLHTGRIIGIVALLVVLISGGLTAYTVLRAHQTAHPPVSAPTSYPTPKGTPLFADTFKNNNQQWNLQGESGKYSLTLNNGKLVLEDDDNRLLPIFLPGNPSFGNFTLLVNATLSQGDQSNGYGLYIRGAIDQNNAMSTYYRVELYGDGTYAIYKGAPDAQNGYTTLVDDPTPVPAIHPAGHTNQVVIVARGPRMSLIINGQTIKTFTDSTYSSGTIGLFVSNVKDAHPGAQATFSNLAIYGN